MINYEINDRTIALISSNNNTEVYELDNNFVINNLSPTNIIKYSCEYFGSTLEGRIKGTSFLTGLTHKVPIIIEESREIIFFPSTSYKNKECSWIRSKYITRYRKIGEKQVILSTINNKNIIVNCSYETINNQILRSSRLESIIRYRKV